MSSGLSLQILRSTRTTEQANKILAVMSEFLEVNTLFVALNDGITNVMLATRNRTLPLAQPASATPLAEAYCRVVIEDQRYVEIPNTADNPRTAALPPTHQHGPASFVGVPLALRDGRVIGTLCGWDIEPFQLTPPQRHLLESMADFLSYVFELEWQSYWDPLTGVGNRRLIEWFLDDPRTACDQKCVVFCDMDNLKPLNDTWGHAAGDQAIRLLARHLQRVFGPEGVVCRSGGDEFVILLPRTAGEDARDRARSVRDAVQRPGLLSLSDAALSVTLGIASTVDPTVEWRELIRRADAIMLNAKHEQKGTVVWTVA